MYDKKQIEIVGNILQKNRTNYWTGQHCKKFEVEFSNYIKTNYSVAVSNGSVALELALKALCLKKGDGVIVSPRSFIISASAVLNLGLKPIFSDVDKNGNLDIKSIEKVYKKNVKALILVHLNGLSCDLDPIVNFSKKKKFFLIEDCSQAHGAIYRGKSVGSFGTISTWSFCQDKIISTGGEGGMISTNNKKIWLKLWSLKEHGKNYKTVFRKKHKIGFRWLHEHLGSNYRLTEMQAGIGRYQLRRLEKQIKKRNQIADLYLKAFKKYWDHFDILKKLDFKCSNCPLKQSNIKCNSCRHAFYRFNFYLNTKKINQKKLLEEFKKKQLYASVGSCPEIYKEKIFQKLKAQPTKALLNTKLLGASSIMLPINPYRSLNEIKNDIKKIIKIFKKFI